MSYLHLVTEIKNLQPRYSLGQQIIWQNKPALIVGMFYEAGEIHFEVLAKGFSHAIALTEQQLQQLS